ncbi:putative PX domain containing serine/threonine kinase, partial [Operophtera brumata]
MFLGDTETLQRCTQCCSKQAVQTVSIALRGDGRYELKGPLTDIGWRIQTGAYVVRRIHENGTLRDLLYGTEYSKSYLSKYGNPKVRKPFTKNILVGGPTLCRPHLTKLRRISSAESVDVYCFGRTLYEMAFAMPLEDHFCDYYPDGVNEDLEYILRLCLSSTSSKYGRTTLDLLLKHPFFSPPLSPSNGVTSASDVRTLLKFPLALKEELKTAIDGVEARLKSDQK